MEADTPKRAASALFMLPDGRIVLQRRDSNARISANMLSTFGGGVEGDEEPEQTLRREVGEETSFNPGELPIKYLFDAEWERPDNNERVVDSVFEVAIPSADFVVKEGEGAEAYTLEELRQRDDLSVSVKALINKLDAQRDEKPPLAA